MKQVKVFTKSIVASIDDVCLEGTKGGISRLFDDKTIMPKCIWLVKMSIVAGCISLLWGECHSERSTGAQSP